MLPLPQLRVGISTTQTSSTAHSKTSDAFCGFPTSTIRTLNGDTSSTSLSRVYEFQTRAGAASVSCVQLSLRGSGERLTPVLMTALVAALALAPLLFEADMPGTEILHPVAVVIFSGLITSTLLDSFLTPAMVALFGAKPIAALVESSGAETF